MNTQAEEKVGGTVHPRARKTEYIRKVQSTGCLFVCPDKDRALWANEEACSDCWCISDNPPEPPQ